MAQLKIGRGNIQILTMVGIMVAIWIFFGITTGGAMFTPQALSNLFRQMSIIAIMACGMVLVIVTGNIDLSVGKIAGFVSVVAAAFQAWIWPDLIGALFPGMDKGSADILSAVLTIIVSVVVGMVIGAVQGSIVAYLGVPSFIVTLGGLFIFDGAILAVTKGQTVPANQPAFGVVGQGYLSPEAGYVIAAIVVVITAFFVFRNRSRQASYGIKPAAVYIDLLKILATAAGVGAYVGIVNQYQGVPVVVLLLTLVTVAIAYVAASTRFGRYAYAIGGNREAARLSGINIKKNLFAIFVLMGGLCGIAGMTLASYLGYGTTAAGTGYELFVIAACILGGTSTLGGSGTVVGAILGALIITTLQTGLTMMSTPPAWVKMLTGIVFILAVLFDVIIRKSSAKT